MKCAVALAAVLAGCIGAAGPVDRVPNVAYAADDRDRASAPVVVFVHGGAFMRGDRTDYAAVGEQFARQGLATAVVSYRNFPQADADGATADVAMAVAWVLRHATDYGLSAKNVFLAGHSAGGQIVALLGVDAAYLERDGSSPSALRGVVAVAGAYDVRDLSGESDEYQKIDAHIFGATPELRGTVSPSVYVRAGAPPTIAVCGTEDDPQACERATVYVHKLVAAGGSAYVIRVVGATHMGTPQSLIDPHDPLNAAFHQFINQHSAP